MYYITTNLLTALYNGYIGELTCTPTPLSNAIRRAMKRRIKPSFTYYYCGERDERLSKMFGWSLPDKKVIKNASEV